MFKKSYLFILFFLCITLVYAGCNKDNHQKEEIYGKLNQIMDTVQFEDKIDQDINLPTSYSDVEATWKSNKPEILSTEGKVNRGVEDEEVKLTLTLTYQNVSIQKEFTLIVAKDNEKASNWALITQTYEELTFPETTMVDLDFKTLYNESVNAVWTSENQSVLGNDGTVMLGVEDVNVKFKVVLSIGDLQKEKTFSITILKNDEKALELYLIQQAIDSYFFPTVIVQNLELPTEIENQIQIDWTSENPNLLSNRGEIFPKESQTQVVLKAKFSLGTTEVKTQFQLCIGTITEVDTEILTQIINEIELPSETSVDIDLVKEYKGAVIVWRSSSLASMENSGKIHQFGEDKRVVLTAYFTYQGINLKQQYIIIVKAYSNQERLQLALDSIKLPSLVTQDLSLPTVFDFGVVGTWQSSNENVITNEGKVTLLEEIQDIILTIKVEIGEEDMQKEFHVQTAKLQKPNSNKPHQPIVYANQFDVNLMENLELKNDKIVLTQTATEGSYQSSEISTMYFSSLIASWASTSSTNTTVELKVKVKVDGVWSDFITYYPWGFGLNNKCYNQTNSLIKLVDDEVKVLNSKTASAIIFQVILRRTSLANESPELSLVSFALENTSHTYMVNTENLPESKVYNVPRLYQGAVPEIGNSICSPTTSTMLLKYKGEDFSNFDTYEHRYIAYKAKEYNSGIFGNWVYNTVCMGAFGYNAYVGRMYSVDELVAHLALVGPCGLSVKGQMTSNEKDYYTNGHLIVAIGYKYVNNVLYILCNDPNVPNVYCEYNVNVILTTWRKVVYYIE